MHSRINSHCNTQMHQRAPLCAALSSCSALLTLVLWNCKNVADLTGTVHVFASIMNIHVDCSTGPERDWCAPLCAGLSGCTALQALDLHGCQSLTDVAGTTRLA